MLENLEDFEQRKRDHIRIALNKSSESDLGTGLNKLTLIHEALPEINFSDVDLTTSFLDFNLKSPLFVSSMTAGHSDSVALNLRLAQACAKKSWLMGVGSQRRQLFDQKAMAEWQQILELSPTTLFVGNIGLAQAISEPIENIQKLVNSLNAKALYVHTNPLQEILQPEGTTNFSGGLNGLKKLCQQLTVPVLLKEVGCGFSENTLQKLKNLGLYAVDVSGRGGTHWGRVEGARSPKGHLLNQTAETFKNWGISTTESLLNAQAINPDYKLWASGGVRSGLDAAKLIAMGAQMVGYASPIMKAALDSEDVLLELMNRYEYELKIALFCTGCKTPQKLSQKKAWKWL